MKPNLHCTLILIFLVFGISCKVTQPRISKDTAQDTLRIAQEQSPTESIPEPEIQDSVTLKVYRLLKDTVSIIGVGDIMLGTNYPSEKYLPAENGQRLLEKVKDILKKADLTFGNLEGVILDQGGTPKECNNPNACYLFRMPEMLAGHLKNAGFDVLSLANNHANDFGEEGIKNTSNVLDSLGIHYSGSLFTPFSIFLNDGIRFGFTAFAPNQGTISIHDHNQARSIIHHLDSLCDIVIVSFHGGAEGKDHQHVIRDTEIFYGENRGNVYEFSHLAIDWGADVIFGHGPHVTRAIEVYRQRFIAYSLGNFCTYGRFNLRGPNGVAPIIKVFVKPDGEFLFGQIFPIRQTGAGIPEIDLQATAIRTIQELTLQDFPEANLVINEQGLITLINQ